MNQSLFKWLLALGTSIVLLSASTAYTSKLFFHNNLNEAKAKAAQEGKLYMVDFTAKWCMPCKWMDETTFADDRVIDYIKDNYVPVKVDIDDFDGFAHKQLYGIKVLPSILIFNSKGKLLEQYTGSHAPSGLLEILKEHNTPENRAKSNAPKIEQPRPSNTKTDNIPPAKNNTGNSSVYREGLGGKRKPLGTVKPNPKPVATPKPVSTPRPTAPKPSATKPAPEVMSEEGLFRFTVSRYAKKGFSVQTGVYAEYGNVLREVEKLQSKFGEDQTILVHISSLNNKKVFKVLIGKFKNYKEANKFKQAAELQGVQGMIKDLQVLKN